MSQPSATVLPIYFVADESGSMANLVGTLNAGLVTLLDAINLDPMAAAKVRFGIVGFADTPQVRLDLVDLRERTSMPTLIADGTTSYRAVFSEMLRRIPDDVRKLKAEGFAVHRPAIFFLTDGVPNQGEDWHTPLAALKDPSFKEHPNILAFGLGGAVPEVINAVASKPEYGLVANGFMDPGAAIAAFMGKLVQSVIASGNAAASGRSEIPFERPEGFVVAMDLLENA